MRILREKDMKRLVQDSNRFPNEPGEWNIIKGKFKDGEFQLLVENSENGKRQTVVINGYTSSSVQCCRHSFEHRQ